MITHRSDDDLVADILEACGVGSQIVARVREAFDADPVIRYAAETLVGRIGDAASKLRTEVKADISGVPWREVIGMRIVVDHAYHRIDPDSSGTRSPPIFRH